MPNLGFISLKEEEKNTTNTRCLVPKSSLFILTALHRAAAAGAQLDDQV